MIVAKPFLDRGGALLLALILTSCDTTMTIEPSESATAEPTTPSATMTPVPWNVRLADLGRTQLGSSGVEPSSALPVASTSPNGGPSPTPAARLVFADQIGGTARLLGDIDGELVAAIGGRIHRFKRRDAYWQDIRASSPLLSGMPAAFVRLGAFAVVGTSRGLTILEVGETEMPIAASLDLGNVEGLALYGHHALALLDHKRLAVVDLADPAGPARARIFALPDWSRSIAVAGRFAYLTGGVAGLMVLDLERVEVPMLLSQLSWPWSSYDDGKWPHLVAVDGRRLFAVAFYESDEPERPCVFAFDVGEQGVLTLLGSLACPGHVEWVKAAGDTLLVMGQEGVDILLLGQASGHPGHALLRGIHRWDGIEQSTAVQIGGEVIIAHDRDLPSEVALQSLRVSDLGGPGRTFNSLDLNVPSIPTFKRVVSSGSSLIALREGTFRPGAIYQLVLNASGLLDRSWHSFNVVAEDLVADAGAIYTAQDADLDVFQKLPRDDLSALRHVGVIQPELVGCVPPETMNIREPTCTPFGIRSMHVVGSVLVIHHGSPALPPYDGPLAFDVSDPRRPDFIGALPADVLVATTTQDGRRLPRPVRVEFLRQDVIEGSSLYAVVWQDDFAFLVHSMCLNPHLTCPPGSVAMRNASQSLSEPAIATLDLPYALAMAVRVDTPGGPLLVAGSADPEPGLYLVDISSPHAPSIAGFVDLPAMPTDIAVSGTFVVVAAGEAGLIVLASE